MDLRPGEEIVFQGQPFRRGLLSFSPTAVAGTVAAIVSPAVVVAAAKRAQRNAGEHAAEPRFAPPRPGSTWTG
jgi:hypothetical protein